jgi:hypothetical protein
MMSMFSRRLLALGSIAALAVTACSEEQAAAPNTTAAPGTTVAPATSTTAAPESTTSNPEPAVTSTTVPGTTMPPVTTTPATTAPPPPSGIPTDDSVELFAGSDLGPWLYVGRWTGAAWEGPFAADASPIAATVGSGDTLRITDLAAGTREGTVGGAGEACFDERIGPVITPNAGVPDEPGFGYSAIAVEGDWTLRPRPVADVDADVPSYETAGVAAFADDDVETQAGEIDQIVVADLDGDGDSEALVVFGDESLSEGDTIDPGFSGLLLIDTDTGAATTITKSFIPLTFEEGTAPVFDTYRVLDVADLNGDGLMEIVVRWWYSEGAGVSVYTYDGTTTAEVIVAGCGA